MAKKPNLPAEASAKQKKPKHHVPEGLHPLAQGYIPWEQNTGKENSMPEVCNQRTRNPSTLLWLKYTTPVRRSLSEAENPSIMSQRDYIH